MARVNEDIEHFHFNTAIAALMEFYNTFSKSSFDIKDLEKIILISAPIFPHIAEEMWCKTMGKSYSVHSEKWPKINKSLLIEENIEIPVQINGKVKANVLVSRDQSEEEIKTMALALPEVNKWLKGKKPERVIVVPRKIISIVT